MKTRCPHCGELTGRDPVFTENSPQQIEVGAIGSCECGGYFEVVSLENDGVLRPLTKADVDALDPTLHERLEVVAGKAKDRKVMTNAMRETVTGLHEWARGQSERAGVVLPMRLDFHELPETVNSNGKREKVSVIARLVDCLELFPGNLMARELCEFLARRSPETTWLLLYTVLKAKAFDAALVRVVWTRPARFPPGKQVVLYPGKEDLS